MRLLPALLSWRPQLEALTNKPLAIAETASIWHVGDKYVDKVQWILDAWRSVAIDFPRVVQLTYFLLNKKEVGPWCFNLYCGVTAS